MQNRKPPRQRPGILPVLALLVIASSCSAHSAVLVQPDGQQVSLSEEGSGDAWTVQFPSDAVPAHSWLLVPDGATISEVQIVTPEGKTARSFPVVTAPGTRTAFETPGQVSSLTFKGKFPSPFVLQRAENRPSDPATPWVTKSLTDLRVELPPWSVPQGYVSVLRLTRSGQTPWEAVFSGDGQRLRLELPPTVTEWNFAPAAWGFEPSRIVIPGNEATLSEVRVEAVGPQANLPADTKTILTWPKSQWRNPSHEWFSWTGTSVLVLVTADYRVQDSFLKRLAFFVEKPGYHGKLVRDEQIAGLHGWNAHDYAAPDLARFFTQAQAEGFPLNASEVELRDRLAASGILLTDDNQTWRPGTGALLGISAQSPPALRAVLLVHESFHGLYFTSREFQDGVLQVWSGLSKGAQAKFRKFLASPSAQYDPTNEPLMINEFQAYVLQRPASQWKSFFQDRVLAGADASKSAQGWLEEYLAAAQTIDALVQRLYGLNSGNVSLVRILSKPET